jgi:prolyl oligopeptidase
MKIPSLSAVLPPLLARLSGPTGGLPTLEALKDPRQWLEDVEGDEQLAWVKAKNSLCIDALGEPTEQSDYARILAILDSSEKIPYIGRVMNGLCYNFWQDKEHVRGIWRRCSLDEYKSATPKWEVVLDLDKLSAADGVTWVWSGSIVLDEGADTPKDRVMIKLSRGGADAVVVREFDLETKQFIPEAKGGFFVPEAKSHVSYKDRDTLLIGGSFFGEGSMTDSGYPRTVHEWRRGTALADAPKVFEGTAEDVSVSGSKSIERGGRVFEWRVRGLTFYTSYYEVKLPGSESFVEVPAPADAEVSTFADQVLVRLRTEWLGYQQGSLLAVDAAQLMASGGLDKVQAKLFTPLFEPTPTASMDGFQSTRNYVVLDVLDNVRSQLRFWKYAEGKGWALETTYAGEGIASLSAKGYEPDKSDAILVTSSSYTLPTTYALSDARSPTQQTKLKALPSYYDAKGLRVQQFEATSLDGTQVPYFMVSREDLKLDGTAPTLLYGYGGFEISLTPSYVAATGVAWLEKGGVYVQANIRGGGEFGPRWHQAGLKANRHKVYEDFEAVAKDLIARKVTCPARLGTQGGSNGGLLMGNMLTRSPELFGAILCQVPLLDMRRYNRLLAGASWMGEYASRSRLTHDLGEVDL